MMIKVMIMRMIMEMIMMMYMVMYMVMIMVMKMTMIMRMMVIEPWRACWCIFIMKGSVETESAYSCCTITL